MKKIFIPATVIAATLITAAAKKNDPTLMNVNGKDVTVSEFEYLYQKNNQQQAQPQTLDEYVDMFVNYKLKVADAEAAGIDTTASFIKEYTGYCDDLAKPFLTDTTVTDRLRHEAYERMKTNRDVSHIMLPIGRTPDERLANRQRLDSIRTAILGGADFGELAVKYSADRSVSRNKGHMGFITAGTLPYPFEAAAYATPVGQISEVIDDAPYGFHIIRVEGERPDQGQVRARHILKLTRGLSEEDTARKKAQIDSIYQVLKSGADFAAVAMKESEDPGSARNGGALPWFGTGQMVKEFEATAFALADSAISEPFATSYGYHIVQKLGHRDLAPYDELKPKIDRAIQGDARAREAGNVRLAELRKSFGAKTDKKGMKRISDIIGANGGLDSTSIAQLKADRSVVATVGDKKVTVSDVAKALPTYSAKVSKEAAKGEVDNVLSGLIDNATLEAARHQLATVDPDYANLVNEYRDGILLFDISNRNVWEKSNKDTEGLEEYFRNHRDNYKWDAPRYKGIIVSATSDSVASLAQEWLKANQPGIDSIVPNLRAKFGRNIKVERKIFPKGEDAVVDYIAFGGSKPAPQGKWTSFFEYQGEVLDAPREAIDVRAAVVNDYQLWLEQQWLDELRKKYNVKINQKELKKLRDKYKSATK